MRSADDVLTDLAGVVRQTFPDLDFPDVRRCTPRAPSGHRPLGRTKRDRELVSQGLAMHA